MMTQTALNVARTTDQGQMKHNMALAAMIYMYHTARNFGGQKIQRIGQKLILPIKILANEQSYR